MQHEDVVEGGVDRYQKEVMHTPAASSSDAAEGKEDGNGFHGQARICLAMDERAQPGVSQMADQFLFKGQGSAVQAGFVERV